jgi:hypothetical protein
VRGGSRFLPIKLINGAVAFYPSKAVALVGREHLEQLAALVLFALVPAISK